MTRRKFIACGLAGCIAAQQSPAAFVRSGVAFRHSAINSSAANPIENPYITDGLVAMWDGEWNSGYGVFDSDASLWMDLSGNGHHLPSLGTPDWRNIDGMHGAYMTTKANCFGDMHSGWFRELWESTEGVYVEVVAKGAYNFCVFSFGGQQNTWQSNEIQVYKVNDVTQSAIIRGMYQHFNSVYFQTPYRIWSWQNLDTFSFSAQGQTPVSGTYTYQEYAGNGFSIGCRGDQYSNRSIQGLISRVAVYNRLLTEEEIAFNAAVDKERFGGAWL